MDMTVTSNSSKPSSNSTAATSAHHHHQIQQEVMGIAPQVEEARNVKQAQQPVAGGEWKPRPQLDEALKCPRCDSTNTKFSYYNNHNMSQPRYFCKACRRYWTQGGSLRNVPVGGGCHKKKRSSATSAPLSSSSSSSSFIINQQLQQVHHLLLTSSTAEPRDYPNVLPTFMSTSFELPRTHLPPLEPLPSTFVNLLRGGIVDDQGNHLDEPTSSSMETPNTGGEK